MRRMELNRLDLKSVLAFLGNVEPFHEFETFSALHGMTNDRTVFDARGTTNRSFVSIIVNKTSHRFMQ